ncbi:MAG: hypothetical protein ACRC57_00060 [Sarcina sp.]
MVDMSNFIDFTFIKLKQINIGQGVCLLTFKKDRKVTVIKETENYTLHEDGFYKESFFDLDDKELKKLLKSMVRREFPRSNRLHLTIV